MLEHKEKQLCIQDKRDEGIRGLISTSLSSSAGEHVMLYEEIQAQLEELRPEYGAKFQSRRVYTVA
jgi:hypothetical protein